MSAVERRFATTMKEVDTDEPGLIVEDDGTVWLVNPDGTREQLGGGGFSLPDEWTIGPGGELAIAPTDPDEPAFLVERTASGPLLVIRSLGAGAGQEFIIVDAQGALEVHPTDNGVAALRVVNDPTSDTPAAVFQQGSSHVVAIGGTDGSGDPALLVRAVADQTVPIMEVQTSGFFHPLKITPEPGNGFLSRIGFFNATPVGQPEVPASPLAQDVVDALIALGLVSQAA